jgi:hypothetical protein
MFECALYFETFESLTSDASIGDKLAKLKPILHRLMVEDPLEQEPYYVMASALLAGQRVGIIGGEYFCVVSDSGPTRVRDFNGGVFEDMIVDSIMRTNQLDYNQPEDQLTKTAYIGPTLVLRPATNRGIKILLPFNQDLFVGEGKTL